LRGQFFTQARLEIRVRRKSEAGGQAQYRRHAHPDGAGQLTGTAQSGHWIVGQQTHRHTALGGWQRAQALP